MLSSYNSVTLTVLTVFTIVKLMASLFSFSLIVGDKVLYKIIFDLMMIIDEMSKDHYSDYSTFCRGREC